MEQTGQRLCRLGAPATPQSRSGGAKMKHSRCETQQPSKPGVLHLPSSALSAQLHGGVLLSTWLVFGSHSPPAQGFCREGSRQVGSKRKPRCPTRVQPAWPLRRSPVYHGTHSLSSSPRHYTAIQGICCPSEPQCGSWRGGGPRPSHWDAELI